jgi:hypothetical protein
LQVSTAGGLYAIWANFGARFDLDRLAIQATPTPLLPDLAANPTTGGGLDRLSLQ